MRSPERLTEVLESTEAQVGMLIRSRDRLVEALADQVLENNDLKQENRRLRKQVEDLEANAHRLAEFIESQGERWAGKTEPVKKWAEVNEALK